MFASASDRHVDRERGQRCIHYTLEHEPSACSVPDGLLQMYRAPSTFRGAGAPVRHNMPYKGLQKFKVMPSEHDADAGPLIDAMIDSLSGGG